MWEAQLWCCKEVGVAFTPDLDWSLINRDLSVGATSQRNSLSSVNLKLYNCYN